VRLSSQQPADYLMGAEVRQARHEYHQVIADCAAALLLEPGTADAHQLRADAWTCQHPFDTAIFDCTEVLPLTPNDAGLLDARPDDLFQEQDFGGLIACSTAAIAIDAEGLLAYQLRASARTRKCEFDNAIADHGQVMILDPKNADAFVRLACNEQEKMEDVDAAATRAYLTGNSSEMKGLKADFDVPIVPTLIPPLTNTNGATIDIAVAPSTRVLVVESAPIEILTDVASAKKQIMATLGSELATGDASSTYDNLAADNASAGDFAAAVLAEAVAIAQCNDQIKKAEYGARLKQYQEKKW
jgi:tetratricopeptide (TPR) repeat protein